jgi:hypothetical protein
MLEATIDIWVHFEPKGNPDFANAVLERAEEVGATQSFHDDDRFCAQWTLEHASVDDVANVFQMAARLYNEQAKEFEVTA